MQTMKEGWHLCNVSATSLCTCVVFYGHSDVSTFPTLLQPIFPEALSYSEEYFQF